MLRALVTDFVYLIGALLASPVWLVRMVATGKIRTDWPARLGRGPALPRTEGRRRILIHAVSVGEVNAIRGLVELLAADASRPEVVVSVTTDTGLARAKSLFGERHAVVRTPFDFSFAVRRWLGRTRPDLLVLVELELWPNTTRIARARGIPIAVVNGRLSDRSIVRYRKVRRLVRGMFARADVVLAQNSAYAERFVELGARDVVVTGNMKWDSIAIRDAVPGAEALAADFGVNEGRGLLVVAGSTEPGEEALLRDSLPEGARLLIAPRKPEWWDGVAANLAGCVRRSRKERGDASTRFYLLDTIGELGMAYAFADIVVMGRSFGVLYGSDPIEPAALGKPVVIGPRVHDFREVVGALVAGGGLRQVSAKELRPALAALAADPALRAEVASRGRAVIRAQQGGTARTAEVLLSMVAPHRG
ncbi:MAG: 3-deoxy-D-manno-octulosonic acid transferase [Planctomycetota bacterium]